MQCEESLLEEKREEEEERSAPPLGSPTAPLLKLPLLSKLPLPLKLSLYFSLLPFPFSLKKI